MALRAVTLTPAGRRLTLTREGWRKQVEATLSQGALALRERDVETLGAIFDEVEEWGDDQRAYQARRQLAELAFTAAETLPTNQWIELFLTVVGKLLDTLENEAAEPVLLNYSGVLLYEIGQMGAADALFAAAERLDPELDHVAANRKAARSRRKKNPPVLPGNLSARARAAGVRAGELARRAKTAEGLTLSLVMIVKNEEEMLPGCLAAVHDAVDEIVIVDTGSTDRTVEIAESFGAKVVDFPWNGSFSDARNCSLEHATGDWVVYLDADEHLVPEDAPLLRQLTGKTWREAFYLVETNYTGGDDSGSSVAHLAMRMFKRKPDYRFEGRIHEQKTQAMPTYLPERFETTEIRLRHFGYLKSRISAKEKSRRNIELLEAEALELPGPFVDFNLGSEYMALGEFATARGYLDRAWDLLRREEGWSGKGYAPMLVARVAQVRREDGDTTSARVAIDEGLARFPDHTELVLQAGLCARDDGNLDEAARLAERCAALGEPPTRYSATVGCGSFLAECLLAQIRELQRRPLEAEALYRGALQSHPEYVAPVLALASSMLARGAEPTEVRAAVPANGPSSRLLLATALYEAGHSAEAEADFRAVLDHQPDHAVARIGLVETLLARRAYDDAAAEAALEPEGSPLELAAIGAELFARAAQGEAAKLREALSRASARSLDPAELELYTAWSEALAGTPAPAAVPIDALGTALTALEALLRVQEFGAFETLVGVYRAIEADEGDLRDGLARIYLRRGYLESALEEWMTAFAVAPEARFLVGLAQVAVARGLGAEGLDLAREAARLDPADSRAARLVAALESR
ncbi:MAG TPA: glycosyltransferase [Gaiellaceae bacterium]|jgi:tetratricopeptide (TPR) repeat protein|nr:glycosyltransferase [Gaiellaceae bacterium]